MESAFSYYKNFEMNFCFEKFDLQKRVLCGKFQSTFFFDRTSSIRGYYLKNRVLPHFLF